MENAIDQTGYWNGYYRAHDVPELPSQFAVFVASEIATGAFGAIHSILDLGCGNGRDSLFLAGQGYHVGGLDQSDAAVAECNRRAAEAGLDADRARFVAGSAQGAGLGTLSGELPGRLLIYSRFFFHAIDDEAEAAVVAAIGGVLRARGGVLAVEFRSLADASGVRETDAHYRRYVDVDRFVRRLEAEALQVVWQAEGRGMAKYRLDDAHVARLVAQA